MNRKRLAILKKYLKTVPAEHFHIGVWLRIDGGKFKDGQMQTVGCDTAACALGWACQIPSFNRDGLYLVKDKSTYMEGDAYPVFGKFHRYEAAAKFFDISTQTARDLFHPDHYVTEHRVGAKDVIKRIDEMLAVRTLEATTAGQINPRA